MPNMGNVFRDRVAEYIRSWGEPLEVLLEVNVGSRFVGTPRKLDIVIRNTQNNSRNRRLLHTPLRRICLFTHRYAPPQRQIRSTCESFVNYCGLLLQLAS